MNLKLAREIKEMARLDQKACKTNTYNLVLAKKNLAKMRKIINKFGWPTIGLVGKKASHLAWLLVQHADCDLKFQKHCLGLVKEAAKRGEASFEDWAYLTDRVLVNSGKPQLFGTQFHLDKKGRLVPRPVKDRATLNQRRKSVGLGSFEKYERKMKKI